MFVVCVVGGEGLWGWGGGGWDEREIKSHFPAQVLPNSLFPAYFLNEVPYSFVCDSQSH